MLDVKKCGNTKYGYWATGTLKYKGLEVNGIFSVDKELLPGSVYEVTNVVINIKKGIMTFKLEL